jgi:hypothetical protein
MTDEHRHKLDTRLTPLHLYKLTPGTNCGQCGFPSCLAFSTQVIVGRGNLGACPYLDPAALAPFHAQLAAQHLAGIGVRRESFEKTFEFLRGEVGKWDFRNIAVSLGATIEEHAGAASLLLVYFGKTIRITADDVFTEAGEELDAWEKILLYNYVIGGAVEPSGVWVGMESLPNSVSKIKSLRTHCEEPLARGFAGKMERLQSVAAGLGQPLSLSAEKVDFGAEFRILPRLPVRVLWWDEDPSEGFQAKTKFIFDARVLQVIDLESLIFACEQLTDRLLRAADRC